MNRTRLILPVAFALMVLPCVSAALAFDPPAAAPEPTPVPVAAPTPAAPAVIDPAAIALLQKAEKAIFALRTYQADCWTTQIPDPKADGTKPHTIIYAGASLIAAKPNKMRYDEWVRGGATPAQIAEGAMWKRRANGRSQFTFVCDGKTNWQQYGEMYRKDKRTEPQSLATILEPWVGFYAKSNGLYGSLHYYQKEPGSVLAVQATGREAVNGVMCDKVFTHIKTKYENRKLEYRTTWYIGTNDGLVRRQTEWVTFDEKDGSTRDAVLHNIRTNVPITKPAKTFSYTPPKGVKIEGKEVPAVSQKELPLLANGTAAPDFSTTDKDNKPVKLSDYRGKVVVVDFWASWCPPCIASMPHNQEVTQKLQKEGIPFVLLAVDNSEARPAFLGWVAKHEADMNTLQFVYADPKTNSVANKQYHVSGIPTQYVIDASGVIRASFVGYGGPTDALEKAVRAAAASVPVTANR